MSGDSTAVLVAAAVSGVAALVTLVVAIVLTRRTRELRDLVRDLKTETVPLVRDARVVVDQAATEMLRVGDVLSSAEAVTGTVDSASRLVYRAFANPVVKVLAFGTGLTSALRRLFSPRARGRARRPVAASPTQALETPRPSNRSSSHRRRRRLPERT